jgi:hypothetical protein
MCVEITMILSFARSLISVRTRASGSDRAVGGLVEDQHARIVQDRLGETDPAPKALRQRLDDLRQDVARPSRAMTSSSRARRSRRRARGCRR